MIPPELATLEHDDTPPVAGANGRTRPRARRAVDIIGDIESEAALPVVSTGFDRLDRQLGGGLRVRSMSVLVAGTGRGKTSLAVQLAARHAETAPCLYYSAELTPAQLVARIISQRTGMAWRDVLTGEVSEDVMRQVLAELDLDVLGQTREAIAEIATWADAKLAAGDGPPLVVVDYAQLLADVTTDMRLSVMGAVRGLHAVTEARDIVTLALAQGSRGSSRAMRASDGAAEEYVDVGAETAQLEQAAANVIALLYQRRDGEAIHEVTAAVAKARFGCSGKVGLRFHGPSGRWEELESLPVPAPERDRRDAVMKALHPSEPKTRNQVAKEVGGRKAYVLESIKALVELGHVRELPGGGLVGAKS